MASRCTPGELYVGPCTGTASHVDLTRVQSPVWPCLCTWRNTCETLSSITPEHVAATSGHNCVLLEQ